MPPLVTILYQIKSKELNKDFINRLASYNEIFKTFYYNFIGFIINKYFIFMRNLTNHNNIESILNRYYCDIFTIVLR